MLSRPRRDCFSLTHKYNFEYLMNKNALFLCFMVRGLELTASYLSFSSIRVASITKLNRKE